MSDLSSSHAIPRLQEVKTSVLGLANQADQAMSQCIALSTVMGSCSATSSRPRDLNQKSLEDHDAEFRAAMRKSKPTAASQKKICDRLIANWQDERATVQEQDNKTVAGLDQLRGNAAAISEEARKVVKRLFELSTSLFTSLPAPVRNALRQRQEAIDRYHQDQLFIERWLEDRQGLEQDRSRISEQFRVIEMLRPMIH